jgi:diaminopimelate decarboxylase
LYSTESIIERVRRRLSDRTPEFHRSELEPFIGKFIEHADAFSALTTRYGSPLYVFDTKTFLDKAMQFKAAFERVFPDIGIYYAVKSNNHPMVAQAAVSAGLGLDVSSGNELDLALDCRCDRILFSGPGKTDEELGIAVDYTDRVTVLVDSFGELDRLDAIASSVKEPMRIGVRICTEEEGLWRKFGISLRDLERFLRQSHHCDNVRVTGIQFHTSWNLDPSRQIAFIERLGRQLRALDADMRSAISFIDIGGGFWPPQGEWIQEAASNYGRIKAATTEQYWPDDLSHYRLPAASIDKFAASIGGAIKMHIQPHVDCTIYTEPGRWLCNDAVHILLIVVDKKADDMAITDGGTNAIGWDRFETDYFPVINLSRPSLVERECAVYGSLCTPHDIWGYSYFGDGIERGDVLLIPTQGAYTYSLRQHFIKPLPNFVQLD